MTPPIPPSIARIFTAPAHLGVRLEDIAKLRKQFDAMTALFDDNDVLNLLADMDEHLRYSADLGAKALGILQHTAALAWAKATEKEIV